MFRFGDPAWLWALALVPALVLLYWMTARSRERALARFAELELARKLTASVDSRSRRIKSIAQLAGVALGLFALARPQFGTRVETVRSAGQDIVVALDLSQSMLAEDVAPNRLERARLATFRLIEQLDGRSHRTRRLRRRRLRAEARLTTDYGAAAMFLDAMQPDLMPIQGTDLGEALRVSLDALEQGRARCACPRRRHGWRGPRGDVPGAAGASADHGRAATRRRDRERPMEVADPGLRRGGAKNRIPEGRGGRRGHHPARARSSRGDRERWWHLHRRRGPAGADLEELVDRIARGEGEELDAREITQFEEQYQIFLAMTLMLLLADLAISDRRRATGAWAGRFES